MVIAGGTEVMPRVNTEATGIGDAGEPAPRRSGRDRGRATCDPAGGAVRPSAPPRRWRSSARTTASRSCGPSSSRSPRPRSATSPPSAATCSSRSRTATSPSPARPRREVDLAGPDGRDAAPVDVLVHAGSPRARSSPRSRSRCPPDAWYYVKAMRRRLNSASIVTVAAVLDVEDGAVAVARIALGGVGARAGARAPSAEAALRAGRSTARARRGRRARRARRRRALRRRLRQRLVPRPRPARPRPPRPARRARPGRPMPSRVIELVVNGEPREFLAPPGTTLLAALRESARPHRRQARLRAGHLRHLHRAGRRRAGDVLPGRRSRPSTAPSVATLEGVAAGGELDESRRRSSTASPPSAASARPA